MAPTAWFPWSLNWVSPDGKKLLLSRSLRSFGYGYLAVILALYLEQLGLSPTEIGLALTAAMVGSAGMTIGWSLAADRVGRRRTVAIMALLMVVGGLLLAVGDAPWIVLLAALTGSISATNSEVGPFLTVEQAVLPQTAPDARRTWLFALYDMLGSFAGAAGALFAGSVGLFQMLGLSGADAYRPLFLLYALIGLLNLAIFSRLSRAVEVARIQGKRSFIGIHRSRGIVARISLLFALDAFAGGLVVHSLVAYWFHLRWGMSPETLAYVFFWINIASGLSYLAASWVAHRIGLLNTMVLTHLPSNLLLMLVPLAPTAWMAVVLFLARMSISQMDVPTRKSYTMALVAPDERTATAGITNVARTTASALSPALTGLAFSTAALGLPFFVAGGLKIGYDLMMFFTFRGVRPPEEQFRA